ncbi:MAG: hypothetical protein HDP34_05655 [Clostridia bacterium]|nr:hypothetical protein [Clostridia bacterium]
MNKQNLEILGLAEGATEAEIKAAYEALRAKYLEERFMDGEAGNNAAKMLTKIDTAYAELEKEFSEASTEYGAGDAFSHVEELIKDGNLQEAQRVLDGFNERGGQWHYLQSVLFYRKNWMNESKKQLEIAIQLDPENAKYKEAYRKLNEKIAYDQNAGGNAGTTSGNQSTYEGQTMNSSRSDDQMGGNFCAQCLDCCYTYLCISCLCDGCCR